MAVETHDLTRDDALALVARHHVGRLGIGLHDLLRVELACYVYSNDWIYLRTTDGEDLDVITRHPWAAFEVDEVDGLYDWRFVEMTGAVEILTSDPNSTHRFEFEEAVRLLRAQVPAVLTAHDPYPERVRLLRIHVDTVRGRQARATGGETPGVRP